MKHMIIYLVLWSQGMGSMLVTMCTGALGMAHGTRGVFVA